MEINEVSETVMEKMIYKSSDQSLSYREIYQVQDKKVKLEIESDSYHNQRYAKAYILKADEWILLYSIPYSLMRTPVSLIYINEYKDKPELAENEFMEDIKRLKHYVKKIIF